VNCSEHFDPAPRPRAVADPVAPAAIAQYQQVEPSVADVAHGCPGGPAPDCGRWTGPAARSEVVGR